MFTGIFLSKMDKSGSLNEAEFENLLGTIGIWKVHCRIYCLHNVKIQNSSLENVL